MFPIKVFKNAVADVQDATVPIVFLDAHILMVATAKFSDDNPEENVYYVGVFGKWLNVNSSLIHWCIGLEKAARELIHM